MPPVVEVRSPNQWTIREFPDSQSFKLDVEIKIWGIFIYQEHLKTVLHAQYAQ